MVPTSTFTISNSSLLLPKSSRSDNHIGINDKTLAEFVIALHDQSNKSLPAFRAKLKEEGADFPDSFVENVDRLILSMRPNIRITAKNGKVKGDLPEGELMELEKKRRIVLPPGLALKNQDLVALPDDVFLQELGNLVTGKQTQDDRSPKRQRRGHSPSPRHRSPSPRRGYGRDQGRNGGRPVIDDRPVLFKIYNGRMTGLKDFGAFVTLEGVAGRAKGMVHISNIQTGHVNSTSDFLSRGQVLKVKVMSVAGTRIRLSMKDVDQITGCDLSPHLRIQSEAEMQEERNRASFASSGANAVPLHSSASDAPVRSMKRLTSPERWEIKQLISSGALDTSEYPELDEDFGNPAARAEVEEDMDIEMHEDEPPFLAGQTKRTLDLSPVKIVKAPDGSLNRAALSGASLAQEQRELRQQEANEEADSQARDFTAPWLDPMASEADKIFAQDMRGNLKGQKASEVPRWKAIAFGEVTTLSIQEQRKNLPIYKLRDSLLQAISDHQVLIVIGDTGPLWLPKNFGSHDESP
ncbi:hypothetical protein GGX14DRAFT_659617 [Mycena pura]|uniref:S1 motif domain-containing protein n=1 Tax=Mycena pura TaxID=153505 RepID=A0AAD6Y4F9_9AGAR|nr:hypothetical protein GGX14DRAFT_659617 [Mycena pura]